MLLQDQLSALFQGDCEEFFYLDVPYDRCGAAEIGMIKIEQVGALLHNPIHVGRVKRPQLQRRYERIASDARKTNINSVFGGEQVALIVLYTILCGACKINLAN
jgi:hypothetical protein